MIKPNKYTNIGLSVIGISFQVLSILKNEKIQKYHQILDQIVLENGDTAKVNFLLSLNFLYMLGKIEYHFDEDIIELLS